MNSGCFLCGTASKRVVFVEGDVEARHCNRCGLIYAQPLPEIETIDFASEHHCDGFYFYPARYRAAWVARHCPPGRLLEVGCGSGYFLAAARERGYEVNALEPHRDRAQRAEQKLSIKVEQCFVENYTHRGGGFDVVYHSDLLAHVPDPVMMLRKMTELLNPGGVLCFEVGFVAGLSGFWYKRIPNMSLGIHRRLFSTHSLKGLLEQSDLELVHIQRYGLGLSCLLTRWFAAAKRLFSSQKLQANKESVTENRSGTLRKGLKPYLRHYVLRYRVGALIPGFGPETALVVARPKGNG